MIRNMTLGTILVLWGAAASAQSSVTIYGLLDIGVAHGAGSGAGATSRTQLSSGNTQGSRLGMRGVEVLGAGYSAGFNLESGISLDTGEIGLTNSNNQSNGSAAGFWGRRSTISLFSPWGELRVGRDFSTQYRNRVEVDPFGSAGIGAIQPFVGSLGGVVSTRVSNMLAYHFPADLGGFYGQAQIYFGENASGQADSGAGNGRNIRVGYVAGPMNASASAARTRYPSTATTGDISSQSIALQYRMGHFNWMTGFYRDAVARSTGTLVGRGWTVGAVAQLQGQRFKAALSKYQQNLGSKPATSKLSLGWEHPLSKRTSVYGDLAFVKNAGGAATSLAQSTTAANASSRGVDVGIKHVF